MSDSNKQAAYAELFADVFYEQFILAFYVNLNDFSYVAYYRAEEIEKKYGNGGGLRNIIKYFYEDVHPDDRAQLKELFSPSYIRERLKKERSFSYTIRDLVTGKERYCKLQISRGRDEDHIAMSFLNVDEDVRKRLKVEEGNRVIQALASEYSSLYCINLDTEQVVSYVKSRDDESVYEQKACENIPYSEALAAYVEKYVCKEDRKNVLVAGSIANIREKLSKQSHFEMDYKNDRNRFCKMKFVRSSSGNSSVVVLGFADRDDKMRADSMNREFSEIANALSVEYENIYYVNLNDESYDEFNQEDSSVKLKLVTTGKNFFDECKKNIKKIAYPQDMEKMNSVLKREFLLSKLAQEKSYSVEYRLVVNDEPRYYRFKALWSKSADDHIIIAVSDVHGEVLAREERKRGIERNYEIIKVLASEYTSVYYIDLETDTFMPYTVTEYAETNYGNLIQSGNFYSKTIQKYIDGYVYDLDKKRVTEVCSIDYIKKELKTQKSFTSQYRKYEGKQTRYGEMKFVKVGPENEEARAVVLCFADKDAEILNRFVDSKLYEDYFGVYFVNLEDDTVRGIRDSTVYEKGKTYGSATKYSSAILEFSKDVLPEFRETWVNMANVEFMRSYLAKDDKREYSYRALKGEWRRATTFVVERKNGVPISFILAFMFIDNVTAQKMELDAKIAEQKLALEKQQALLEKALLEAESANKAKTMFLSNMSHDIRTPMNAIIGFTNLALNNLDNPAIVKNYLDKTVVSSTHLLSLINDILDMSRIESGKISLENVECSLSEIMHDLNTIILGEANAKQQKLFMDSFDIENENIVCDKLRLHQVLINLLSNAVKFTPVGGNIHVFVRQVSSDGETGTYEFHVKDDGIGMSPEFLKVLYDPFERERTSTISKTQGTGLGMSITKKIVDLMGGKIDVVSAPNHGTEYTTRLTFKIQKSTGSKPVLESLQNARALVVESDYNACSSVTRILGRLGMRAEWTMYGKEAVLRVEESVRRKEEYSVIVVDSFLFDMPSMEVVRQLSAVPMTEKPIVLMTSYDWTSFEKEARDVGVTDFMCKPLFLSEAYETLARATGVATDDRKKSQDDAVDFVGKKILLVEDNELNREIAQNVLEGLGFIVHSAEDGLKAVEMLQDAAAGDFDLVLMDVQMPVMDGLEAARRIRSMVNVHVREIPIIAMTANAFEEDRKAAIDAGMNDHVAKPIDVNKLTVALKKFLS